MHPLFLYSSGEVFLREDGGGQEPVLKGLQEGENRPHDTFALTGQCKKNDRTIRLQRPHNSAPTTARFRLIDCTIFSLVPDALEGGGRTFGELFQKPPEFFKNVSAFRGKALGLFMKRIRRFYGHKKPRLFGAGG